MRQRPDHELKAVGLVGCGSLGRRLGQRLLAAGYPLTLFDRDRSAAESLIAAGARWAASPTELARSSSATISCLPGPDEVEAVASGPDGLWTAAAPGTLHLETSTVGPASMKRLARAASAAGIRLIDCAVSRGPARDDDDAEATLVLWIGAAPDHFDLARALLERLGDRLVYCGGVGLGQTTKIVNNLIAHTLIVLCGEALALGVRAGAALDVLSAALRHGTGQNRVLDELFPLSLFRGDFTPGLRLDLALKDLELARQLACDHDLPLSISEPVRELFEQARARGWGDLNAHVAVRLIEERTGVQLRSLAVD